MDLPILTNALSLRDRWQRLPENARGVIWILVGCLTWTINDALVKATGRDLNPFQIAFVRYTIGVVLLLPPDISTGC